MSSSVSDGLHNLAIFKTSLISLLLMKNKLFINYDSPNRCVGDIFSRINKVTVFAILSTALIAVIGLQNASAQLGIDIGNAANNNNSANTSTEAPHTGAHITISNEHWVTTHSGIIGP